MDQPKERSPEEELPLIALIPPVTTTATEQPVEDDTEKSKIINSTSISSADSQKDPEVIVPEIVPSLETVSQCAVEEVDDDDLNKTALASDSLSEIFNVSDVEQKTMSRELKSLINSAKDSKIISEFTQITNKIRKSRKDGLNNSNSSLNSSIDADKILASRRSSSNSIRSNSSDVSEKTSLKRSMRSQNPEFVTKHKKFLSSLAIRHRKDDPDSLHTGSDSESCDEDKSNLSQNSFSGKSPDAGRKSNRTSIFKPAAGSFTHGKDSKKRTDPYCWRCHWAIEQTPDKSPASHLRMQCSLCPRSLHFKCLNSTERNKAAVGNNWVCPECLTIMNAENGDTRSPAMRHISLGMLCDLLKYALQRMTEVNGTEPFLQSVDRTVFPDYDRYVVKPMDLGILGDNIDAGLYGSTEAFLADTQWILHNSIIFNTLQSRLTSVARVLMRVCRTEMASIEGCPECYAAAHARRHTWFTDVCSTPHILLWAKLKGFPYWPAKGMSVNASGMVDVRFFGAHDRAWVPARDCLLYSQRDPNNFRTKRQDILDSVQEAEQHVRNIGRKFGKFIHAEFRTPFDVAHQSEQLRMMIPGFTGKVTPQKTTKEPTSTTSSPLVKLKRCRSNSKSSKDESCLDGFCSEEDESLARTQRKMADGAEIVGEEDETANDKDKDYIDIDNCDTSDSDKTRKRRRSEMQEAVCTVLEKRSDTRNRLASPKLSIRESPVTISLITVPINDDSDESKEKDLNKGTSEKDDTKEIIENTQSKMTANATADYKDNPSRNKDKTLDKDSKLVKCTVIDGPTTNVSGIDSSPAVSSDGDSSHAIISDSDSSPNKNTEPITKPTKDRILFHEDCLIKEPSSAKEVVSNNISGLPTISSVRSLSTQIPNLIAKPTSLVSENQVTLKSPEVLKDSVESNIFKPTGKAESLANMKDAMAKLQKLREEAKSSRVNAQPFAKSKSPPPAKPPPLVPISTSVDIVQVDVQIKSEPMDFEDAERTSEKLDLLSSFRLRPVNSNETTPQPRDIIRIDDGPPSRRKVTIPNHNKVNDVIPRARKTFPLPKKMTGPLNESTNIHAQNSMVYIPILPAAIQAPTQVNSVRPGRANGTVVSEPVCINNMLNAACTTAYSMAMPPLSRLPCPLTTGNTLQAVPMSTLQTAPTSSALSTHWTFNLAPTASVATLEGSVPLTNGTSEHPPAPSSEPRPANSPVLPVPPTEATTSAPNELPALQFRPTLRNPLDPATPVGDVPAPSTAGAAIAILNQNAVKLTDYFRHLLSESLEMIEDPVAQVASLRLKLEQESWRHEQEMTELKHNHDLVVAEQRASLERERIRAVSEIRRSAALELTQAVNYAKSRQWCANCRQESQFYCCWNTSYCDFPCQRAHWAQHYTACTQQRIEGGSAEDPLATGDQVPEAGCIAKLSVGEVVMPRVYSQIRPTNLQTASILVSVQGPSGACSPRLKYVGAAPRFTQPTRLLNKQLMHSEEGRSKVVTPGGYLIVGSGSVSGKPTIVPQSMFN